jgi:uncharacterized protein (DUF2267 family)/nucleotide-binding universal stress UspA family protein
MKQPDSSNRSRTYAMSPIRTILHPTDFSDCSRHAGEFAANLANDYHARLVLLHVVEPPKYDPAVVLALPDITDLRSAAEAELDRQQISCKAARCERALAVGSTAVEILRVAGEINPDLIVLGTHGRTGLRRLVIGSIAEEVIRRAPCPVLSLKPTDVQQTVDYEDWIAEAMAVPERREERAGAALSPESLARAANASYAATVEHTLRTTNRWLRDVRLHLREEQAPQAFRLVRAVLHVLRDHLSVDHTGSLAAQLPLLLRGVLFEGWDPANKPEKQRHQADFVNQVKAEMAPERLGQPERSIHAVLAALGNHLTAGEVAKLKRALPHEIRELWELRFKKPVGAA